VAIMPRPRDRPERRFRLRSTGVLKGVRLRADTDRIVKVAGSELTDRGGRWGRRCLSESVAEAVSGLQRLTTSRSTRTREALHLNANDRYPTAIARSVRNAEET